MKFIQNPFDMFTFEKSGSSEKIGGTWNFQSNVQNSEKRSNSERRVIRKFRPHLSNNNDDNINISINNNDHYIENNLTII